MMKGNWLDGRKSVDGCCEKEEAFDMMNKLALIGKGGMGLINLVMRVHGRMGRLS